MRYFVTGATGFIGKRLVKKLLERKGTVVHFLIRPESADKVAALRSYWGVGASRAIPVHGSVEGASDLPEVLSSVARVVLVERVAEHVILVVLPQQVLVGEEEGVPACAER